jgi:diguanylate cyclase (GGDEF)-like protein
MPRSGTARPLEVLVISEDRRLQHQLSRSLTAFGYKTQQAVERERALDFLAGGAPDVVLLDAEPDTSKALELCRTVAAYDRAGGPFVLLLVAEFEPGLLTEALAAGVEDFLDRSVVYGELLARLRAAARVLEFERRLVEQRHVDPLTGLPNRLPDPLPGDSASKTASPRPAACVLLDVDLQETIRRQFGQPASDAVIRATADGLRGLCGAMESLYSFGEGRFCVWIQGASEGDAAAWAESARPILAETEVPGGRTAVRFTVSCGVAARDEAATDGEAVLARATQSLQAAIHSGRDGLVRYSQLAEEGGTWADFAAPGKLFERTTARDVMTPCPMTLRPDQPLALVASLFRHTPLAALPVVDEEGKLAGLVLEADIETQSGPSGSKRIADAMTEAPAFDEETTFAALRDFFTEDDRGVVVVTREDRPTGLVTPDSLAALCHPLSSATFATTAPASDRSDYLVVPDLRPLA